MALESIALVPSGYKATKVYSQLPVNGNGDFTFDRGTSTTQTRVNKNGLIEDVAQDVPRLDYFDGGCPSLLLEPSSTNLITYSEDIDNAAWSKFSGSVTANAILSPDGSVSADKFEEDASTGSHFFRQTVSVTSGNDYTGSIFLKAAEYSSIRVKSDLLASWDCDATFDLINGTVSVSNGEAKIEDYGNGWYRCSIIAPVTVTGTRGIEVYTSIGAGTLGDGFYCWGAQLEQQSYATSYIPTSGSTETRAAETCNGAGTTAEINSQEGVIYWETKALNNPVSNTGGIGLTDGTADNKILLYFRDALNDFRIVIKKASINVIEEQVNFNYAQYNKIALNFADNNVKLYINGIIILADTTQTMFGSGTLNDLSFNLGGGSDPVYCRTKRLSVYDSALTDSQLEALTGFGSFAEMKSYLSYS